jgi:hypothetical protein
LQQYDKLIYIVNLFVEETMSDIYTTQQALSDLKVMRQAVLQSTNKLPLSADSIDTHLMMNIVALCITIALGCWDLMGMGSLMGKMTDELLSLAKFPEARPPIMGYVGAELVALVLAAQAYISFKSKHKELVIDDGSERSFVYFKNISALSDIFVKYCVTAVLVLAGKPELVAPIFVLFVGDLALQGRLLVMPSRMAGVYGAASFVVALAVYGLGISSMMWPIAVAAGACVLSLITILRFRRRILLAKG